MLKLRLYSLNSAFRSIRQLHLAQANVIQTKIDKNSTEYQVKSEKIYFATDQMIFFLSF